jgi:hypothetical protein
LPRLQLTRPPGEAAAVGATGSHGSGEA